MEELQILLKKYNKVFKGQIRRAIKKIQKLDLNENSKNNLCEAGELLIYSINMFQKNKATFVLPCLRNIYDMLLKALVMDKNHKVLKSYNDIGKSRTEADDDSSQVRQLIAENFSDYFSGIEFDELFKITFNKGILTYVYDMLCLYSHATKISEFAYSMEKSGEVSIFYNSYLTVCLLYPLIIFYLDGAFTKIEDEFSVAEVYIIFMNSFVEFLTYSKYNVDFARLKELNDTFFGEKTEKQKDKINKEKEFSLTYLAKIQEELLNQDKDLLKKMDEFLKSTTKKYFK